ncbi:TRAP transporter substrate-binding protein [Methylobacterium sp. ID0610]|uniref:TRAP transporter substrate-binding protein n=1 Tax=Methylobacterium carpenticola TaxID=3344827 RepID=UPI0036B68A8B
MSPHSRRSFATTRRPARNRRAILGLLLTLLATTLRPALAADPWVMTTEYPQSNISGAGLTTFARLAAEHSQGAVTVAPAFDNTLKIPAAAMLRAAQDGQVAGGDAFAGPLEAEDPVFGLPSLPFLVQSVETAKAAVARARPLYAQALERRGLQLLYVTIWPSTGLWSARPLGNVEDLRRIRVRTYDATSAEVMRQAGATAEFLPFNEAIAKVRSGAIDAILTSGDGGAGRKLWDDLRHFTSINYAIPISVAFIRKDVLAALPPEQQAAVMRAAAETERSQIERLATRTAENYARMRENGVAIEDPAPAALVAALKQAAAGSVATWKGKVPPEAAAIADWAAAQSGAPR